MKKYALFAFVHLPLSVAFIFVSLSYFLFRNNKSLVLAKLKLGAIILMTFALLNSCSGNKTQPLCYDTATASEEDEADATNSSGTNETRQDETPMCYLM